MIVFYNYITRITNLTKKINIMCALFLIITTLMVLHVITTDSTAMWIILKWTYFNTFKTLFITAIFILSVQKWLCWLSTMISKDRVACYESCKSFHKSAKPRMPQVRELSVMFCHPIPRMREVESPKLLLNLR